MEKTEINIGVDFSPFPGGRVRLDGPHSGEEFRDEYLFPALRDFSAVEVKIDDVFGYGSSFLEECFGGLVRHHGFSYKDLKKKLILQYEKPGFEYYIHDIWQYIQDADQNIRKMA